MNEGSHEICQAAIAKVDDQKVLGKAAKKGGQDYFTRLALARKVTDNATLFHIAMHDANPDVSEAAIKNITDVVLLDQIIGAKLYDEVCKTAQRRKNKIMGV